MRNPIMIGRRVYLRPYEVGDGETAARWYHEEAETFWDTGRMPISQLAHESMAKELYEKEPPRDVVLSVCLRENDELIGMVGFDGINWVNRTAETFSYFGSTEHRGRGLGTEAKLLMLEYAFDHLGLHCLRSMVFEPNERSWRALAKQGYQPAGRLRAFWLKDGAYRDALMFDLLREDWLAAKAKAE